MSVATVTMDNQAPKGGLPWHWLILLPVAASVVAGLTTLGIAIKYGDRPLPETVTHAGPVQYGVHVGVSKARELGISGIAQIDSTSHSIRVEISGRDLPARLMLRLWHPTETNRDQISMLTRGDDGSYRGVWPAAATGLMPLLSAPDSGWELPGEFDAAGTTLQFRP